MKPFSGQEFQVVTYWDIKECLAIANRIYDALNSAEWKYIKPEGGRWLMAGISGLQVYVNTKAEDKTKRAAKALVDALNTAKIDSELRDEQTAEDDATPKNRINLNVGAKP